MAEKKRENWKTTKKSTQVEETINKMYSAIKDKRIKKEIFDSLGDRLEKNNQFNDGFSWKTVKGGNMKSSELVSNFVHYAKKTFISRGIFLDFLENWNPSILADIKSLELKNTLAYLSKDKKLRKFCSLENLIGNGSNPPYKESKRMIETLSTAFGEEAQMMRRRIEKELRINPNYRIYMHDKNKWNVKPLSNNWDPLVFYICANIKECIICIQVDETEEYRVFPDKTPKLPAVRFGQIEQFEFVYLPGVAEDTDETEGYNDEKDNNASTVYLENQREKLTRFLYPNEVKTTIKKAPSLNEKHLINENRKLVDETLSIVHKHDKELIEKDQRIDKTLEQLDYFTNVFKEQLTSLKTQPNTIRKQPPNQPYRQPSTCSLEKYSDAEDLISNDEPQCKEDIQLNDKLQGENELSNRKIGASRMPNELIEVADVSNGSVPKNDTPAGQSRSTTSYTSHC